MKKTVFGFSQKEVTETIDNLTNQNTALIQRNDRLEDELKELKIQLEEAKVANEGLMSRAECSDYENIKKSLENIVKEVEQLKNEKEQLEKENAQLKNEKEQLKSENAQLKNEKEQLNNENAQLKIQVEALQSAAEELKQKSEEDIVINDEEVNECLNELKDACHRSYNSRGKIGKSMQEAIDQYVNQWVVADEDFRKMTEQAEETRQNAKKNFVNSAKNMLSAFEQIDECNKLKL